MSTKRRKTSARFFWSALGLLAGASGAFAQDTVFTYQGRLNENGAPVSGNFDLGCQVFDALLNGRQIAAVTNTGILVSNGLFAVTLTFAANPFNGNPAWLQFSVRTNGSALFAALPSRQQVAPSPLAVYATNASLAETAATAAGVNSISAASIAGAVSLAQLPGAVVTNNQGGLTLQGVFNGDGHGLSGVIGAVPWQIVSGTAVTAQPQTGYLLTNVLLTTVTLPSSPGVGDVIRITGAGAGGWILAQGSGQSVLGLSGPYPRAATTSGVTGYLSGPQYTSVAVQYVGHGQFACLSSMGIISSH